MKFRLIENTLNEDLQAVRNRYPNMSDAVFNQLVQVDPTYREGSNSAGKYTKWILDRWNRGDIFELNDGEIAFKGTEGSVITIGGLKSYLETFNDLKSTLPNQDIGQFRRISDFMEAVDNLSEDNLSARQKERRTRNAYKDTELVYESPHWWVYTPTSFEGSCTLGKGTEWCTAYSENDYYYNHYSSEGPLYVIINKENPKEKYQFHFESQQFMDAEDVTCCTGFFDDENRNELLDFFDPMIEDNDLYDLFDSIESLYGLPDIDKYIKSGDVVVVTDFDPRDVPYEIECSIKGSAYGFNAETSFSEIFATRDKNNYIVNFPYKYTSKYGHLAIDKNVKYYEMWYRSVKEVEAEEVENVEELTNSTLSEANSVGKASFFHYYEPVTVGIPTQISDDLLLEVKYYLIHKDDLTVESEHDQTLLKTYINEQILPNISMEDVFDFINVRIASKGVWVDFHNEDSYLNYLHRLTYRYSLEDYIETCENKLEGILTDGLTGTICENIRKNLTNGETTLEDIGLTSIGEDDTLPW